MSKEDKKRVDWKKKIEEFLEQILSPLPGQQPQPVPIPVRDSYRKQR